MTENEPQMPRARASMTDKTVHTFIGSQKVDIFELVHRYNGAMQTVEDLCKREMKLVTAIRNARLALNDV
jgi:hypothetical protein